MQQPVLELLSVGKTIRKKTIIKDINLNIYPSEIFGFLGPNGAGKTTTIRMIVGLIKPTLGDIKICGFSIKHNFVKAMSNVGCIIESPDMYKYLTGMENLCQYAAMDKRITKERMDEVVEMVGLEHRIHDKVGVYSLGMRQRLGIAQAILVRPKLLILDEPTNGLDPAGISEFRILIRKLAYEEQMAVFVSSHLLLEAQLMCDRVAIIKQGSVIKSCAIQDIVTNPIVEWHVSSPAEARDLLKAKWDIEAIQEKQNSIKASIGEVVLEEINQYLVQQGIGLKLCSIRQNSLEDLFLNLTEGDEIV